MDGGTICGSCHSRRQSIGQILGGAGGDGAGQDCFGRFLLVGEVHHLGSGVVLLLLELGLPNGGRCCSSSTSGEDSLTEFLVKDLMFIGLSFRLEKWYQD